MGQRPETPRRITVIPGEGIGPEIMTATLRVIEASGAYVVFEHAEVSAEAGIPDDTIEVVRRNSIALKGPTTTPVGEGARSLNVQLREIFETYANVRPARSIPGVPARATGMDIVVIRENLEDLYLGLEACPRSAFAIGLVALSSRFSPGRLQGEPPELWERAFALKVISVANSRRIARFAFEYARKHGRKRVTCVHKANILKETDGLFLRVFQEVGKEYPEIEQNDLIVDNAAMQIVLRPERLDVLLCPNLYGDILSDVCAGMAGGLGFAPGANIGDRVNIFEAVHGTAPDIAGKNIANPSALILSGVMMLREINEAGAADRIERALERVVREGRYLTGDIARTTPVSTTRFAQAIIEAMG